jgi:Rrf2 family protein
MVELAKHWKNGPTLLKDIARKQNVSLPYLARLMSPLISAGLVRSTRGAHGGVWLVKPPAEVNLAEVVRLLEGPVTPMACVSNADDCPRSEGCATRDVWTELETAIAGALSATTLRDLVDRQDRKGEAEKEMYYI